MSYDFQVNKISMKNAVSVIFTPIILKFSGKFHTKQSLFFSDSPKIL